MAVTHTTRGFVGQVDEVYEAKRLGTAGAPFRVTGVAAWALSANVGVDRTVSIAVGEGAVCGGAVYDSTTAADSVTFAANTGTQNRYDAVVLRVDWATHTAGFVVIAGTSSPPAVNVTTTIDNTKINRVPGFRYDALLGVVRVRPSVGPLTSGDVVDCRVWGGFEGYANTPTGQYLTMLDTFPGSLVHAVDTDLVWKRMAGGFWAIEGWIGTDRTKQPMFAVRNLGAAIHHNTLSNIFWPDSVDHSGGQFSLVNGYQVRCNAYGRVRVLAQASSDASTQGTSRVSTLLPSVGGDYITALDSMISRDTGYPGAGTVRHTLTEGPIVVQPGDIFSLTVTQYNLGGSDVSYDSFLTLTYV